ncbi:MAG: hypothetical protein C4B58_14990 [Deltaproteobacteria bacterium]|nr:MAG: hypothetical protein C4B58_14990 [Deltaproteobacteria bacterium]
MANFEIVSTAPEVAPKPTRFKRFFSAVDAGELVDGIFLPFQHMRSITDDPENNRYDWGIGDFVSARDAVDFAATMDFHILQLLPTVWSAAFHSPYSVLSPQAMDPEYLGIPALLNLLKADGINVEPAQDFVSENNEYIMQLRDAEEIDHSAIMRLKLAAMQLIWEVFRQDRQRPLYTNFLRFRKANCNWLEEDILYFLLKQEYIAKDPEIGWDWRVWSRYETGISERDPKALALARERHKEEISFHSFVQFVLDRQWRDFVSHASARKIRLMMDMPFAPADARVWQLPEMASWSGCESGYQRIEVQGVPGKKETPLGQIWQFTVYDYANPAAIEYINNMFLWYRQRGVAYIRVDHVPGYYQVFVFRQDVDEEFTLERLGIYDSINAIREKALAIGTEAAKEEACIKARKSIIDALLYPNKRAPRLPDEVCQLIFNDDGSLHREGNMVMVARKLTAAEFNLQQQRKSSWHTQWQTEDKIFREQPYWEFLRLTPNKRADDDGFTREWLFPDEERELPKPTDSIRMAYYRLGPGEAILYNFDRFAQESGMVVILETLGNVTNKMLASSQRTGGYPLIPVIWGLEETGRYYPAKFEHNICATMGVHDSYGTPVAWQLLRREDKLKLLHLFWPGKNSDELEAFVGKLKPEVNEMILKMVCAPHTFFKAYDPERSPAIVVLQLLDIFMLEAKYRLNSPGELNSWKRRLPPDVSLPELMYAAQGQSSSKRARAGMAMLQRLLQARHSTLVAKTLRNDTLVGMKPNIAIGSIQVRQMNRVDHDKTAPFFIDVYTRGELQEVSIIFLNRYGEEYAKLPIERMSGHPGITEGITNWVVRLRPRREGVYRYKIEMTRRDGTRQQSGTGLLVAVSSQKNLNFLAPDYVLTDIENFRIDSPR